MNTSNIRTLMNAVAAALIAAFATGASAQVPMPACQTPTGVFPMPNGIPQPGLPCGNGVNHGVTIILGGGAPAPYPVPFPGQVPGSFPAPYPMPGQMPGSFPAPFPLPGMPAPMPNPYPPSPQGITTGQIAGAFGVNREGQVAAQCVGQFGMTKVAAACVAGRLTTDELNKCLSDGIGGRGCFGENNTLTIMLRNNLQAAQRERGLVDQAIRAGTGVSIRDIRDRGVLGGDGSEARKACNAVAGIFGGSC